MATDKLAQAPGHVFYRKLNQLMAEHGFDRFVEDLCLPFHEPTGSGRPSIPPGVYLRILFVGYFVGIDSQRSIAWRCEDSLSLREFVGIPLTEATPDHSTLTSIRSRLPKEIFDQVFGFVLQLVTNKRLPSGKTVAVDSTTLEANAAMKSIVRKDTGEDYKKYLTQLAQEEGIENPSDEDLSAHTPFRKPNHRHLTPLPCLSISSLHCSGRSEKKTSNPPVCPSVLMPTTAPARLGKGRLPRMTSLAGHQRWAWCPSSTDVVLFRPHYFASLRKRLASEIPPKATTTADTRGKVPTSGTTITR
jgi:transposase